MKTLNPWVAGIWLLTVAGAACAIEPPGRIEWVEHVGGYDRDASQDMCGLPDGSFYVTGWFEDIYSMDIPYFDQPDDFGKRDIFLSKYSVDGELLWVQSAGSGHCDVSGAVDALPDGTCAITGAYGYGTASCTFGSGQPNRTVLAGIGRYDVCIAKYDADGFLQWAKRAGGPEWDFGEDVSLAADGAVYVAGSYGPSITFALGLPTETTLTGVTEYGNVFLARYGSDGSFQWAKDTQAYRIAALTDGGCVAAACPGLIRYSADGTELWSSETVGGCFASLAAMPGNDFVVVYNALPSYAFRVARFHAEDDGTVSETWSLAEESSSVYFGSPIATRPDGIITFCPYTQICSVAPDGSWLSIGQTDVSPVGISLIPDSGMCYLTQSFYEDITVGDTALHHLGDGDFYIARATNLERCKISAHCEGSGWIQFDSEDARYWRGDIASLQAVPVFPGVYEFMEWGGDLAGMTGPSVTFPVTQDMDVVAVFAHVDGAPELPAATAAALAALAIALGLVAIKKRCL